MFTRGRLLVTRNREASDLESIRSPFRSRDLITLTVLRHLIAVTELKLRFVTAALANSSISNTANF